MALIVTSKALIMCAHLGRVELTPKQQMVTIQHGAVLCEPDLVGAPIVGCIQPATPTSKPCTTVVAIGPGSTSLKVTVGRRRAYVSTLIGVSDGVPPGEIRVALPGQMTVQD
jgi:hypothetical protein